MKFRTEIEPLHSIPLVSYDKKILCIGSCFAEHIYRFLTLRKYRAFLNPCGIAYNPISIAESIDYGAGKKEVLEEEIHSRGDTFFHYDFHSSFSEVSKISTSKRIAHHLQVAKDYFPPDVVIISLGTSIVHTLQETGSVVNNCHKMPSNLFTKQQLSVDETEQALRTCVNRLRDLNSNVEILVTVSPVRHVKEGLHGNNISKATLLLALNRLEDIHYFPSYEILIDDLRDYRFYNNDLIHPSDTALSYILGIFESAFFEPSEEPVRNEHFRIAQSLSHRPLHKDSQAYRAFLQNLCQKMEDLSNRTDANYDEEIHSVREKLLG